MHLRSECFLRDKLLLLIWHDKSRRATILQQENNFATDYFNVLYPGWTNFFYA